MKLVLKAIKLANKMHRRQVRKATGDPYITHPLQVSYILAAYKRSKVLELLLCAAILHDCMEDTGLTYEEIEREFGYLVASLVKELTDDPVEKARLGKLEYQKRKLLILTSYALLLKLCDRLANVSDHPTKKALRETLELLDHLVANRKLTKPQTALVADIRQICVESLA